MFKLEKQKEKAVLTIYGYVGGYWMDFRLVHAALAEVAREGLKQLDFHIHTYGGNVFDGNLIVNFIEGFRKSGGKVTFYIDGVCASMGPIITTSGDDTQIAENGYMMIHSPQGGAYGVAKQLIQYAKLLTSMEKNFTQRLVAMTKKTAEFVRAWFDGVDYWFDADECVALGLASGKFSAVADVQLSKDELKDLGAEAVYNKFTALLHVQPNSQTNPKTEMDKKAMIARYSLTGVTEESTDEQILAALDAKMKSEKDTATQAAAEANKKVISQIVAQAVTDKLITDKQVPEYEAHGEKLGADSLKAILANMKPYQPVAGMIQGKGKEASSSAAATDRSGWSWDEYQENEPRALEAMAKSDPESFKALYKAKYNVEPEV